jgi:hypothetical protein
MHLYLLLEIALIYGKDIDDPARIPEMVAIIGATAAAAAAPLLAGKVLDLNPALTVLAGGVAASALTRLIGKLAIEHYCGRPVPVPGEAAPQAVS